METKEQLAAFEYKKALETIQSILIEWNEQGKYSNLIEYAGNILKK